MGGGGEPELVALDLSRASPVAGKYDLISLGRVTE